MLPKEEKKKQKKKTKTNKAKCCRIRYRKAYFIIRPLDIVQKFFQKEIFSKLYTFIIQIGIIHHLVFNRIVQMLKYPYILNKCVIYSFNIV